MTTIAYDLDGVFIPDCDVIPFLGGLDEFYTLAHYMRPVFVPRGAYAIITARHPKYRRFTQEWIDKHMTNRPIKLYHEINDTTPEKYKAKVITENDIDVYVESDMQIVNYLKANTTAQIIHFSEFVGITVNAN